MPDTRNSKVVDIVRGLTRFGIDVEVNDPVALAEEAKREHSIELNHIGTLRPADALILAVAHDQYLAEGWSLVRRLLRNGQGLVLDVKSKLDRASRPDGIDLWRL